MLPKTICRSTIQTNKTESQKKKKKLVQPTFTESHIHLSASIIITKKKKKKHIYSLLLRVSHLSLKALWHAVHLIISLHFQKAKSLQSQSKSTTQPYIYHYHNTLFNQTNKVLKKEKPNPTKLFLFFACINTHNDITTKPMFSLATLGSCSLYNISSNIISHTFKLFHIIFLTRASSMEFHQHISTPILTHFKPNE